MIEVSLFSLFISSTNHKTSNRIKALTVSNRFFFQIHHARTVGKTYLVSNSSFCLPDLCKKFLIDAIYTRQSVSQ